MAIHAATQSMNFAPLFLDSVFFIASLILVALLFLFQVEQRVEQTGDSAGAWLHREWFEIVFDGGF